MIYHFFSRKQAADLIKNGGDDTTVSIHQLLGVYFFLKGLSGHHFSFFFASKSTYEKVKKISCLKADKRWSLVEAVNFISRTSTYNPPEILLHLSPFEGILTLDLDTQYGVETYQRVATETPLTYGNGLACESKWLH
jgi:hypothetical protein